MSPSKPVGEARERRRDGEYEAAGDYYTIAAHRGYAKTLPDSPWFGAGLFHLERAALCYELAGLSERRTNRCQQGILIAEDMIDRVFAESPEYYVDRARRGVWYEYIGDFRLIGDLGDPSSAYDEAIAVYEDGDDPDTFYAEQEQTPLMLHYTQVAEAVGRDPEPIDSFENDLTFVDWVQRKRDTYPELLEALYEQGEWG